MVVVARGEVIVLITEYMYIKDCILLKVLYSVCLYDCACVKEALNKMVD